jgi:glucose/arabinose dehydrogenase
MTRRDRRQPRVYGIGLALLAGCWYRSAPSEGGGQITAEQARDPRRPAAVDVDVPSGYRIELFAHDLTFPTGIAFGDDGTIYVVESGYSYGEVVTQPRLVELDPQRGTIRRELARGTHGPWNGVAFHDGALFVAQGGAIEQSGRLVRFELDGRMQILVDDLPTGDHHTNGPLAADGWIYFAQGTRTNSGVVGVDNHEFGWLARAPTLHDVPCRDVTLAGTNFTSRDPRPGGHGEITTGAYLPLDTPSTPGQVIRGQVPCSGAVMRVRPDGRDLELVAWGLRNPFGLARGDDGLYVTDNGYDVRGSRPVFGSAEHLWKLEPGAWYGWPDFVGGAPLTVAAFALAGGDPKGFVLAEHPGTPPAPLAYLPVHGSANGFDLERTGRFGERGHAYVALFGDLAPTVGKVMGPVGFKVVRVDLATGIYRDFARNRGDRAGPASRLGTRGLERPIAARFDPSGEHLYIVDFGVLRMTERGPAPEYPTGAVWRISREARHARDR